MPRNPSAKQQEASRANGRKGLGAKTEESRQRSAQNSRKTGLFAQTVALPHEQAEWSRRSDVWHNYYGPQSPAAVHLTNECARPTLLADRSEKYRQAEIERQANSEQQQWHQQQHRKANRLAKELNGSAETTVEKLQKFSAGVRWMRACFQEMIGDIQTKGYLDPPDVELAIRLFGVTPTRERIAQDVMAYGVNLYSLGCTPGVSPEVIQGWLEPANRPDEMQGIPDDEVIGDADENRELLIETIEEEIERLRIEERRLWVEIDQPSLEAALDRASILTEAAARRVARSHSEARTTFHRASKDLWPLLDREREGTLEPAGDDLGAESDGQGHDTPEAVPVSTAPIAVLGAEEGRSQNEPEDRPAALAQVIEIEATSDEDSPVARDRQNGVLSPVAAPQDVPPERRPSESDRSAAVLNAPPAPASMPPAPAIPSGLAGPGGVRTSVHLQAVGRGPSVGPAVASGPALAVPLGGTGQTRNEPENGTGAAAQVPAKSMGSDEGRPAWPGSQNGVLTPPAGLHEPLLWGPGGLDPSRPPPAGSGP